MVEEDAPRRSGRPKKSKINYAELNEVNIRITSARHSELYASPTSQYSMRRTRLRGPPPAAEPEEETKVIEDETCCGLSIETLYQCRDVSKEVVRVGDAAIESFSLVCSLPLDLIHRSFSPQLSLSSMGRDSPKDSSEGSPAKLPPKGPPKDSPKESAPKGPSEGSPKDSLQLSLSHSPSVQSVPSFPSRPSDLLTYEELACQNPIAFLEDQSSNYTNSPVNNHSLRLIDSDNLRTNSIALLINEEDILDTNCHTRTDISQTKLLDFVP